MDFKPLDTQEQLNTIKNAQGLSVIFKHNTTCSISKAVRAQFEQEAVSIPHLDSVYFLDLLANRAVSDAVAAEFGVAHESPQLLLIRNGECVYNASLYNISASKVAEAAA